MTKDSGSQVFTIRQPTRERVGLIVDGINAAAAVKTIVAAEVAAGNAKYGWDIHSIGQMC